tara:strand:- start:7106 stop:8371 length:1266 start_codon:yes stop_codon:yes gene_type:complete
LSNKKKILTLSDHPLSPSGVGTQTKYVIQSLLKTGRYSVISLGGAMKHQNYQAVSVEPYGEDWKIIPVDGYGTQEQIRSILRTEKIDGLWIMTDPRFWGWLWAMENEIRPLCPIIYYHVWDNYPYPKFNKPYYLSNDCIATISKVTDDIVKTVAPEVPSTYIPHAVDSDVFKPFEQHQIDRLRNDNFKEQDKDKIVFFWNNRNARRKQSGTLIFWFKEWLDKHKLHDKAQLIMHTDPNDMHGQELNVILQDLGLTNRQVLFSVEKVEPNHLAALYNMADCTINISDAEGFGLATLESLSCGTPIIVTLTGGLQEQVTNGTDWFGIGLKPASKSVIGSQQVPYICEDRISKEQLFSALTKIYFMSSEARKELGAKGREHVLKNYNFETFNERWVTLMDNVMEQHGSWENRKQYNGIYFGEVA